VGGIFPMPKATEVQAQDVLRAYQFNWDDDMVRAPQAQLPRQDKGLRAKLTPPSA
jgi:hypothetical protein